MIKDADGRWQQLVYDFVMANKRRPFEVEQLDVPDGAGGELRLGGVTLWELRGGFEWPRVTPSSAYAAHGFTPAPGERPFAFRRRCEYSTGLVVTDVNALRERLYREWRRRRELAVRR